MLSPPPLKRISAPETMELPEHRLQPGRFLVVVMTPILVAIEGNLEALEIGLFDKGEQIFRSFLSPITCQIFL